MGIPSQRQRPATWKAYTKQQMESSRQMEEPATMTCRCLELFEKGVQPQAMLVSTCLTSSIRLSITFSWENVWQEPLSPWQKSRMANLAYLWPCCQILLSLVQSHHTWWSRHHETEYPPAAWGSTVSRWYWGYLPTLMVTKGYILAIIIRYLTDNVHLFNVWICPVRSYFCFFRDCDTVPPSVNLHSLPMEMEGKNCVENTLGLLVCSFLLPHFLVFCSRYPRSQNYLPILIYFWGWSGWSANQMDWWCLTRMGTVCIGM